MFQSKGISSSSLKHLRYLKRFLATMNSYRNKYPGPGGAGGAVGHSPPGPPGQQLPHPSALKRPAESRHVPPHPANPYPPLPRHLKIEEPEEEEDDESSKCSSNAEIACLPERFREVILSSISTFS